MKTYKQASFKLNVGDCDSEYSFFYMFWFGKVLFGMIWYGLVWFETKSIQSYCENFIKIQLVLTELEKI